MRSKVAWSLDSRREKHHTALAAVLRWLRDEAKDKKGDEAYSTAGWKLRGPPRSLPRQDNDDDCGVFASMFIFYLAQGVIPTKGDFSQKDIPALRLAIAAMILRTNVEGGGDEAGDKAAGAGGAGTSGGGAGNAGGGNGGDGY